MKLKYLSIIVLSMFLLGNTQCHIEDYSFLHIHKLEDDCNREGKTFKIVYNKENIPNNYTCK